MKSNSLQWNSIGILKKFIFTQTKQTLIINCLTFSPPNTQSPRKKRNKSCHWHLPRSQPYRWLCNFFLCKYIPQTESTKICIQKAKQLHCFENECNCGRKRLNSKIAWWRRKLINQNNKTTSCSGEWSDTFLPVPKSGKNKVLVGTRCLLKVLEVLV